MLEMRLLQAVQRRSTPSNTISVVSSRAASYVEFEEMAVADKSMSCGRGGNQAWPSQDSYKPPVELRWYNVHAA